MSITIEMNETNTIEMKKTKVQNNFFEDLKEINLKLFPTLKLLAITIGLEFFALLLVALVLKDESLTLYVCAILIGPWIEEFIKRKSIQQHCIGSYFILFNIVECFGFVTIDKSLVFIRLAVIFMHYATTQIQKHYASKEKDISKNFSKGFYIALSVHMIWNAFAILENL